MTTVTMWWKSFYGNEELRLALPPEWDTRVIRMSAPPPLTDAEIAARIRNPIGSAPLRDRVAGKRSVCVAVDDITKPTEARRIVPAILDELHAGGIDDRDIYFVIALGTHRAYPLPDLARKLGEDIVRGYRVYNHNCYQNNRFVGTTSRGTALHINALFLDADVKIGVGGLLPHSLAGFSGGGKIVFPGLASIDGVEANHRSTLRGLQGTVGSLEGNEVRADINEAARMAGLSFLVNTVNDEQGRTCGLFAGDPDAAYREAHALAVRVYGVDVPYGNDIGIFNAFPRDTWLLLSLGSLDVWSTRDPARAVVRDGGTIVIVNHASEGQGEHGLMTKGMRHYVMRDEHGTFKDMLHDRTLVFFSPNITRAMLRDYYAREVLLYDDWSALIAKLRELHPGAPRVAAFPSSAAMMDRAALSAGRAR
jgi:nickel-dependent lactate racemase